MNPKWADDVELARRAADGEPAAVTELVIRMAPTVDGLARAACRRSLDEAPDLAQEALLACVNPVTLGRYSGRGPLSAYLRVVAHHRIVSHVRTKRWAAHMEETDLSSQWPGVLSSASPENESVGRVFADALEDALMDEPEAVELILRAKADGLTDDELARALGCPVGTVKSTWSRARRRLAAKLRAWEEQ